MEITQILQEIYGSSILNQLPNTGNFVERSSERILRTSEAIRVVDNFLSTTLSEYPVVEELDNRLGRIGPNNVIFELTTHQGLFCMSADRLHIASNQNFSTIRANVGVFRGRWMYEIQLNSKGSMQLGWCTNLCKFSEQCGVGDTPTSFAYDGKRVKKWNVSNQNYGQKWTSGDIIGIAIDLDNCKIDFYRNGNNLGTAFTEIPIRCGVCYYPGVSLGLSESVIANFGSKPFRYPIQNYEPLHYSPIDKHNRANILFIWFSKIVEIFDRLKTANTIMTQLKDNTMSIQSFLMCLVRSIVRYAGPLLHEPFVIDSVFVPFLETISRELTFADLNEQNLNHSKLLISLELLSTFLEEHEFKVSMESTIISLYSVYREVSVDVHYVKQCESLSLLIKICQHAKSRQALMRSMFFDRLWFINFTHVKVLNYYYLTELIDKPWWEREPIDTFIEPNRHDYFNSCKSIEEATSGLESLQILFLMTLLTNSDGTRNRPSSRTIFLRKFRRFIKDNISTNRVPVSLLSCCFFRIVATFKRLWECEIGEELAYVPCRTFYDSSVNYSGLERFGGLITHLNRVHREALIRLLGSNHGVLAGANPQNRIGRLGIQVPRVLHLPLRVSLNPITPEEGSGLDSLVPYHYWEDDTPINLGMADPRFSLLEFLDGIILFYNVSIKKVMIKIDNFLRNMAATASALSNAEANLLLARQSSDIDSRTVLEHINGSIDILRIKMSRYARHMAWVRAVAFTKQKNTQILWFLNCITLTLEKASQEGDMFQYVPEFYLNTLTELFVCIKNFLYPRAHTYPDEGEDILPQYRSTLESIAHFCCNHFRDERIVNGNAKETVLLAVAGYVSNPRTLDIIENIPIELRKKLIKNLLQPFDNGIWAQVNWILVRIWQGQGFAFRFTKSPHIIRKTGPSQIYTNYFTQPIKPCPSVVFQNHIKDLILEDPDTADAFLNSLVTQINWTFSEFIGMIQEIESILIKPERNFLDNRQLNFCATCFDLTIQLIRTLEMISNLTLTIYTRPMRVGSDTLLPRVCQLLNQIMYRMSLKSGSLQRVQSFEVPQLNLVHHFPILAAVAGVLLAMLNDDMLNFDPRSEVRKITRTLVTDANFHMNSVSYLVGGRDFPTPEGAFSLSNYEAAVSSEEFIRVRRMVHYLAMCNEIVPDLSVNDDDNTCTICYASLVSVKFEPCNHRTCRSCIDRHLLTSKECFFCKTQIMMVIDLTSDIKLYDFTKMEVDSELPSTSR